MTALFLLIVLSPYIWIDAIPWKFALKVAGVLATLEFIFVYGG